MLTARGHGTACRPMTTPGSPARAQLSLLRRTSSDRGGWAGSSQGQSQSHEPTSPRTVVKYEKLDKHKSSDGKEKKKGYLMSFIFTPKVRGLLGGFRLHPRVYGYMKQTTHSSLTPHGPSPFSV